MDTQGLLVYQFQQKNLDEFTERLTKQFDKVIPKDFFNKIVPDLVMKPEDVNIDFLRDLNQYAPFGAGFPYPVVEVKNLLVDQVKEMGKANKGELKPHLKYLQKKVLISLCGTHRMSFLVKWNRELASQLRVHQKSITSWVKYRFRWFAHQTILNFNVNKKGVLSLFFYCFIDLNFIL